MAQTVPTSVQDRPAVRARRLGWGLADQVLSSLTNFGLSILVARSVATSSLGAFGLAFTTYTITLGATRALCSEPLSVRYSATSPDHWEEGAALSTGAAVVLGAGACGICLMVGSAIWGTLGQSLAVMGLAMPGLIVQDTWRTAFFSRLRGSQAFMNDLVWAVAQAVFVAIVLVSGHPSTPAFIAAWGAAANVAALYGAVQAGRLPRPSGTWDWLTRHRDLGPRYLVEFAARNAAQSGSMFTTAAFSGLAGAGALRGAQIALGPLNILNIGITAPAITEAVRIQRRSPRRMLRMVAILGASMAILFTAWGLAMFLLPAHLGHALLRRSWAAAHPVILPYTAVMAASGALTGATVGLRALAASKRSMRARLITGVLALAGATAGAALDGAVGAASGLAVGLGVGGIQWWIQLRLAVHETESSRGPAQPGCLDGRDLVGR